MLWGGHLLTVRLSSAVTPRFASLSATRFARCLTWLNIQCRYLLIESVRRSTRNSSFQLFVIMSTLWPCWSLVAILMMTCESPSIMTGWRSSSSTSLMPARRPSSSATLLVSQPILPQKVQRMSPLWSRIAPP